MSAGMSDPAKGINILKELEDMKKAAEFRNAIKELGGDPDSPLTWGFDTLGKGVKTGVLSPQEAIALATSIYFNKAAQELKDKEVTWRYGPEGIAREELGLYRERLPFEKMKAEADMLTAQAHMIAALRSGARGGSGASEGDKLGDKVFDNVMQTIKNDLSVLNNPNIDPKTAQEAYASYIDKVNFVMGTLAEIPTDKWDQNVGASVIKKANEYAALQSARRALGQDPRAGYETEVNGRRGRVVATPQGYVFLPAEELGVGGKKEQPSGSSRARGLLDALGKILGSNLPPEEQFIP